MHAIHDYQAQQSDELSLVPGDVVNVLRKLPDGINTLVVLPDNYFDYTC